MLTRPLKELVMNSYWMLQQILQKLHTIVNLGKRGSSQDATGETPHMLDKIKENKETSGMSNEGEEGENTKR